MGELTIEESISDPNLIYIGRARVAKTTQGLASRLTDKITDHLKNIASPHSGSQLDSASKAAVDAGSRLEISWATAQNDEEAAAYEAALIRRYDAEYGRLPGFTRSEDNRFFPGNKQKPADKGPAGKLLWSSWAPMNESAMPDLPKQPGVYRIRALPEG